MMAQYMQEHIGEEFEGTIVSNNGNNIRVKTNNLIYGIVDSSTYNSLKDYKIGVKVLLKVENVSMIDRTIYFNIIGKLEESKTKKLNLN